MLLRTTGTSWKVLQGTYGPQLGVFLEREPRPRQGRDLQTDCNFICKRLDLGATLFTREHRLNTVLVLRQLSPARLLIPGPEAQVRLYDSQVASTV